MITATQFATETLPHTLGSLDEEILGEPVIARDKVETMPYETLRSVPLNEFVALSLSGVPQVEAVYTSRSENLLYVWTVLIESDEAIRKRIYGQEQAIIEEFPRFDFDFTLLFRRGRDLQKVVSDPGLVQAFRR